MSADTLLRHWKMLQLVPRYPRKVTAKEICERLRDRNYKATERTIQRDLEKLSGAFALTCDTRTKPYGWSWDKDAKLLDIPGMDLPTALAFYFVHEYIEPLLPASVRNNLKPHVDAAKRMLDAASQNDLLRWPDKIIIIPQGQKLASPRIDQQVMDTLYEALLRDRQVRIKYRPRIGDGEVKEHIVHPLGLVLRNQIIYLVTTMFTYQDIRQLALHRVEHAELLELPATRPPGFSLKQYVEEGSFEYPIGAPIKLQMLFERGTAFHLTESPLSADQTIEPVGDAHTRITATVLDTQQLRWWLLAFGDQVVIEHPESLRAEMLKIFNNLVQHYQD